MRPLFVLLFAAWALASCTGPDAPLDADTRQRIDSTVISQERLSRIEIDSMCAQRERTDLPRLVDSFKQLRLREIQEQLKTVPK